MDDEAADRPGAPALLRGVAFAIDAMLALMTVFAVSIALPGSRLAFWPTEAPLFHARDVAAVLALLALRDVLTPASPAKWLLCLRLERPSGARLPFAARLARAPLSLLPFALAPWGLQSRLAWRVRTYVPSRLGLGLRTACTASAAFLSVSWAVVTLRPSIATPDAERLATALVHSDPQMQESLGLPVQVDVRRVARRGELAESGTARFGLRLRGTHARQEMIVHARRVDGRWTVEELSDIELAPLGREPDVAER